MVMNCLNRVSYLLIISKTAPVHYAEGLKLYLLCRLVKVPRFLLWTK
jgi:hypothetical protein